MFVCHGNICRSPMAEFIAKHIVRSLNLENDYIIASSATSIEELGNPIYPPAKRELYRRGIPFSEREAVKLSPGDYAKYDLFALMDERNMRNIGRIFSGDPDGKIKKLLSFAGEDRDVFDPWYSGDFVAAFNDIAKGVIALLCSIDGRIAESSIRQIKELSDIMK